MEKNTDKEIRNIIFDEQLKIEAYTFKGLRQKFPNHFHECYVIGFIESGLRHLSCKNFEYVVKPGDILIFNPKDNHTCEQIEEYPLDYRCINIPVKVMKKIVFDISEQDRLPYFNKTVISDSDFIKPLKELHEMICAKEKDFQKEEIFFFLIEQLIEDFTDSDVLISQENSVLKVQMICDFLEKNYAKNISLFDLSSLSGFSKYYLLRIFTKHKGISPYRYLENIRISKSKELLEKGSSLSDTAIMTGFSDQSHFNNYFKNFTGLTPRQYRNIFMSEAKDKR